MPKRKQFKFVPIFVFLWMILASMPALCSEKPVLKDGDLVFQSSDSSQAKAIELATKSRYSHMGMVFFKDGHPMVLEAVGPVVITSLDYWIKQGRKKHWVVKRLKDTEPVTAPGAFEKMKKVGFGFIGKPYDFYFEWSDKRQYCSELVWKIYKRGIGVEIGKPKKIGSFDLSHPVVQAKIRERWKNGPPLDEMVISPGQMFESKKLTLVYSEN